MGWNRCECPWAGKQVEVEADDGEEEWSGVEGAIDMDRGLVVRAEKLPEVLTMLDRR